MKKEITIEDYLPIVGEEVVKQLKSKIKKLSKKRIVCISSTHTGGGVAEMLNTAIPMFNDMGLCFGWRILHGTNNFFEITKGLHNALQGAPYDFDEGKRELYYNTNKRFSKFTHLRHDLVVVHDPQPMAMIEFYKKTQPWIIRLHIDITAPDKKTFKHLVPYINRYDHMVVSKKEFIKPNLKPTQSILYPAIDPLSLKNIEIDKKTINQELAKKGVKKEKFLITQVSRFDKWKGFPGVIKMFEEARKEIDAQLILCGTYATDDPEGEEIYYDILKKVEKSKYRDDIQIVFGDKELFVNALQRVSDVVIQNSNREGFGLTVSEALYKGTPVLASKVGGVGLQIKNGFNGYLHKPDDYKAYAKNIIKIAKDPKLQEKLGQNGKKYVIENFLITRWMLDWLEIFESYLVFPKNIKHLSGRIITKLKR
jgi:trehalose synthase